MSNTYQELWNNIKNKLKKKYDQETFDDIFSEVNEVIKEQNGTIYIKVPNAFTKHRINTIYSSSINEVAKEFTTQIVRFKFVTSDEIIKEVQPLTNQNRMNINNLNENHNFESYVVGESNMFAYRVSINVAEQPGIIANPLYIFGGVGLGKTHLMQAIGNYILDKNPNNKILYIQANDFIVDYSNAIQNNNLSQFNEKYGDLDILLVDDIQMLEIGKKSQQEFFKLFNDMINQKKQIVVTSDCPASQLKGIMDRLTSRFASGMTVDIKHPDLEQRVNILKRKAIEISKKDIDVDVLRFISTNFPENVRELEGALNRVLYFSELMGFKDINMDVCIKALESLLKSKDIAKEKKNDYENVLSVIAKYYNISISDIISLQRKQTYVLPRHVCMYILKEKYSMPYKKIGQMLGNRDHTTVMNGCKKITDDLKTNDELKQAINLILKKCEQL